MNTKQMVVLWYAGLLLTAILLLKGLEDRALWAGVSAIILMSAILIYTLRPHPQVKKSRLALWVLAPFLLLAVVGAAYMVYHANRAEIARFLASAKPLSSDQYEIFDETIGSGTFAKYQGRLKNKSNLTIMQAKLQIVFVNNAMTDIFDTRDVQFINLAIPPGHVGMLSNYLYVPSDYKWKWMSNNVEVWGRR